MTKRMLAIAAVIALSMTPALPLHASAAGADLDSPARWGATLGMPAPVVPPSWSEQAARPPDLVQGRRPSCPSGPNCSGAPGGYAWPVVGPILRGFEPPPDPYSAGHRGIDIGAPFGSPLLAAQDGTVAFAGYVAGALYISVDHPDGVRTTYSWLSAITVTKGQVVTKGQTIGSTGHGHPEVDQPHLHFGAKVGSTYIDPMTLLGSGSVVGLIHLAPLDGQGTSPALPATGPGLRC
jgi:murein DD-endopeptidase MepM/ murein hydrolase activator NlpD